MSEYTDEQFAVFAKFEDAIAPRIDAASKQLDAYDAHVSQLESKQRAASLATKNATDPLTRSIQRKLAEHYDEAQLDVLEERNEFVEQFVSDLKAEVRSAANAGAPRPWIEGALALKLRTHRQIWGRWSYKNLAKRIMEAWAPRPSSAPPESAPPKAPPPEPSPIPLPTQTPALLVPAGANDRRMYAGGLGGPMGVSDAPIQWIRPSDIESNELDSDSSADELETSDEVRATDRSEYSPPPALAGLLDDAASDPMGMLAGAFVSLITKSQGFAQLLEAIKGVVQSVADTLGSALTAVLPLVQMVAKALRPLLDALTPLLLMIVRLNPQFMLLTAGVRLLAPALRWLAVVANFAVASVTQTIIGFLHIVRKLLKKLGLKAKAIDKLIKAVREATAPLEEVAETANSVSEELLNAPDGFRLASLRFMATTAGGTAGSGSGFGRIADLARRGERIVNLRVASANPERMWGQFRKLLERDNYRASGTPLSIVTPFSNSSG